MINASIISIRGNSIIEDLKRLKKIDFTPFAIDAKVEMIDYIETHKKRVDKDTAERKPGEPTAHLRDVIQVEVNANGFVGIGNLEELETLTPYWALINYGGIISSGPVPGQFNGEGQEDAFGYNSTVNGKSMLMNPVAPIEGMHYIEATIQWIDDNFENFIKEATVR